MDDFTAQHRTRGPRLYHKKSRTGCIRCKQRRVKCDENRPSCGSCSKHAVECVYPNVSQSLSAGAGKAASASGHDDGSSVYSAGLRASAGPESVAGSSSILQCNMSSETSPPSHEHRLSPGSSFYTSPNSSYHTPVDEGPDPDIDLPEGQWRRFWELRLLLNHHANMVHPWSQPQDPKIIRMWDFDVPDMALRMAQQHNRSALLYIMFASSALHMWTKSTDSQERSQLMKLQQTYQVMCSKEQRRDIEEMSQGIPHNADYVCLSSLRILVHSLSLVQTLTVDPWEPPIQWLHLGRGAGDVLAMARQLIDPKTNPTIGLFLKSPPDMRDPNELIFCDHSQLDWLLEHPSGPGSMAAQEDRELDDEEVLAAYGKALSYTCSIQRALDRGEPDYAIVRRFGGFAVWVPVEFTRFIEQRRPRALVILAHFMSFWLNYEHIWMIGRAGEWQIRGIHKVLPIDWSFKLDGLFAKFKQPDPPKRKAPADTAPKEKQSKLAKEHNISAREESEIKEAWAMFAEPMDGEKEGAVLTKDVKRAMNALGIRPTKAELKEFLEIMDPDDEGYTLYEPFLAICALEFHKTRAKGGPPEAEVDEAFALFTGSGDMGAPLTLAHLKRVAMTLKQNVDEQLLKDMILEANGGAGVGKGVGRAEFEEVIRKAGGWK
ncbi:hypothetical protein Hte_006647 [Hypoxylon texense]